MIEAKGKIVVRARGAKLEEERGKERERE